MHTDQLAELRRCEAEREAEAQAEHIAWEHLTDRADERRELARDAYFDERDAGWGDSYGDDRPEWLDR